MPNPFYEVAICNLCNGSGVFHIIGNTELSVSDGGDFARTEEFSIRALRCFYCGAMNFSLTDNDFIFDIGNGMSNDDAQIIYPEKIFKDLLGLPPQVKQEYEAAKKIRFKDINSYAVALGRVLDLVCQDKGVTGKNLMQNIQALAQKIELPPGVVKMMLQLKDLRNIAAHGHLGTLTANQLPLLDYLCDTILEYLYHAPEMTKIIQLELDSLKKQPPQT